MSYESNITLPSALLELQSDIETIKNNHALQEEISFVDRAEAIDYLDFHVIDRFDGLLQENFVSDELIALKQRAQDLKHSLENIDKDIFLHFRTMIHAGTCTGIAFKHEIEKYLTNGDDGSPKNGEEGYDALDLLINGIFHVQDLPMESKEREPEMVFYQKTPARIIFELAEKAQFGETDVFYDLGSGLGQVPLLMHLLTGVMAKGIEFEPAFCQYAQDCASTLNLKSVEFINADARSMLYNDGTVFFMYTPFVGSMMQEMLNILREESKQRRIRIFTYGPCTEEVAKQKWLIPVGQPGVDAYILYEFQSMGVPIKGISKNLF